MSEAQHIRSRLDRYAEPAGELRSPFVPHEYGAAAQAAPALELVQRTTRESEGEIGRSAMAGVNQWVVKDAEGWGVRGEDSERMTERFATQEQAIARGAEIARNQKSELVIQGEDHLIRERISYGGDPGSSPG